MRQGDCWCCTKGVIRPVSDLLEKGGSQREYERRAGIISRSLVCPAVHRKETELQRARMCCIHTDSECMTGGHD